MDGETNHDNNCAVLVQAEYYHNESDSAPRYPLRPFISTWESFYILGNITTQENPSIATNANNLGRNRHENERILYPQKVGSDTTPTTTTYKVNPEFAIV